MAEKLTMQEFDDLTKGTKPAEETPAVVEIVVENKEITDTVTQPTLEEVFKGKFTTVDDFNKHWEEFETTKKETESLRQTKGSFEEKEKTYLQKLKEYEEAGYIDDEQYYKLAKLKKSNPEKAKLMEKVLFGNINPVELAKLKFIEENPLYADKTDYIDGILSEEYGLNIQLPDEDEENYTEVLNKKRFKEVKLSAESEAYKKKILSELDTIEVKKPKTEEDKKAEFNTYIENWKVPFKQLQSDISEMKITDKGEDGEVEELFTITLTDAEKEKYLKPIVDVIASGRYETNAETLQSLKEMVEEKYWNENKTKIIKQLLGRAKQDGFDYYRKKHVASEIKNTEVKTQVKETDPKILALNSALKKG